MQIVDRTKTVSEYKIPMKFFKNVKTTYWISILYEHLRERGTQKSFVNTQMPKRTYKNEIDDTDSYHSKAQEYQRLTNLQIISDMVEPPKPKYPQSEDYCHYSRVSGGSPSPSVYLGGDLDRLVCCLVGRSDCAPKAASGD
jgi:hypothetical protein